METRDAYTNRIVKTAKKLIESGVTDPSATEITCALLREPPPSDPLAQPGQLGGEIYNGVIKRLPLVRRQLEDVELIQCAMISSMYYTLGHRHHPIEDEDEARMCLPSPGRRAIGLVACKEGEDNLIYRLWLEFNIKPGASRTRRSLVQAGLAYKNGVLTAGNATAVIDAGDAHLQVTPAQQRALIKKNGGGALTSP
jgi:hypothetical protein